MVENRETDLIQEKGSYVKIRYCLKTGEGEYIKGDPREGLAILEVFTGYNQLIPGLEKRLVGRRAGEKLQTRRSFAPKSAPQGPRVWCKTRFLLQRRCKTSPGPAIRRSRGHCTESGRHSQVV